MPLCPQITITPVTVTSTGMTQTSVIAAGDPATTEQLSTVNTNAAAAQAAAAAAQAEATVALADAATANSAAVAAQSTANTAITNAATANANAIAANTAASVAQSTANGKNKVTYSTSAPGSTANAIGDIWYQYGTTAPNVGRIIAQFSGDGGTSWTPTTISGLVIANIDAGNITTGTLTAAVGISNPSGNFSVNGATGALVATGATITGNITATSGTFTGTVISNAVNITGGTLNIGGNAIINSSGFLTATGATITGTITATSGTFTGTINATSGYIGNPTTGWQFRSAGTIANNDNSTIFYPTGNIYAMITNQPIATNGIQCDGDIETTGTAIVSSNGTNFNRNFFSYYNTVSLQSISGGYGIDSDWSPQNDNTYNLGQATSAGYGANRRWQRLYSNNTTISTSDVNAKTDVTNSPLGLDFINSLRPISYRWIVGHHEVVKDADGNPVVIGEDSMGKPIFELADVPGKRLHYGFIAQEVKQAVDASGVEDFAGWVKDDISDPNSTESLSYEQFIAPMAKAIQELSARVQQLEGA
jgi:Chaperone of endosialidase